MEDQRIKEFLIEKDPRFRELYLQHQDFEERLQAYAREKTTNEAILVEEQNLKKKKLKIKDEMQRMIYSFRKTENK